MFTERVSIVGIHWILISIIQNRVDYVESVIEITIFVVDTKRNLWVVVCSQCPMNYSNVMHTLLLTKEALPPYAYLAIMTIMLQAFRPIA